MGRDRITGGDGGPKGGHREVRGQVKLGPRVTG